MKYIFLVYMLAFSAGAVDYEFTLKHLSIKQELKWGIEFNQKAVMVGVNAWHKSGFGIGASIGKGDKASNSIENLTFYENEINSIHQVSFKYRYNINNELATYVEVGRTEYNTTWYVDGKKPLELHTQSDSGTSFGIGLTYKINSNLSVSGGFAHLYDKHKKSYGDEKTTAFVLGVSYIF